MKTAIVTGANKGIGFEIVRQLGRKGFLVFLSGRSVERVEDAIERLEHARMDVEPLIMDVADVDSIERAFQRVSEKITKLDVLINNAGILHEDETHWLDLSNEKIENTLNINALGPLYVSRIFKPLLTAGSHVINISSGAGKYCDGISDWAPAYSISKVTLNAITRQLAREWKPEGIRVNSVDPGWVRTDMGGDNAARSVEKGAETPVWLATEASTELTGLFFKDKRKTSW